MFKNLFSFKKEKHFLDAKEAKNILRYGIRHLTPEEVMSREITDLESSIKLKSGFGTRIITKTYPKYCLEIAERMSIHFKSLEYTTDVYKNDLFPDYVILVIGW